MTVLSPLLLLASVALAVPLLIHLLRRRDTRTLVFPALRYLKRTTREHARIVRLRQLLLLALRIAAVLLAVLAGARLVLPLGGSDEPPAGLVIVVDNGLTSGTVVGDGRLLDSIRARATGALERAGARDRIWIIETGTPARPSLPLSLEEARARLAALTPTHVMPDLRGALERAADLLDAGAPETREILLISGLDRAALEGGEPGGETHPERVVIAPPPGRPPGNRGIGRLLVSGGFVPRAGDPGEIEVAVAGASTGGAAVRGYLGDRLIGTSMAGTDGTAVVTLPRLPAGWATGRVEIEPDNLRGDDIVHFAFRTIPPPTVGVLGQLALFVEEALSVLDEAGRIRLADEQEAAVEVVSGGALRPPADRAAVILIPPDEPALLPSLNRELGRLLPGWSLEPAALPAGTELSVDAGQLVDVLPSEISVRQFYRIGIPDGAAGWSPLLTLSNGEPWLVEAVSDGRPVMVLASPLTERASDLPASTSMLPVLEVLTGHTPGSLTARRVAAGEPFPLPDGAESVARPDGTAHPVSGRTDYAETETAGVYDVLGAGDSILARVAVNAGAATGTGIDAGEAARLLSGAWPEAEPGDAWPEAVLRGRDGSEVGRPLLLTLLIVLIAEVWLASVGTGSRPSRTPSADKPSP